MTRPAYPWTGAGRLLFLCPLVATGLLAGACRPPAVAPVAPPAPGRLALYLLGEALIAPGRRLPPEGGPPFGSVSGLAADDRSGQWVGVVDERRAPRLVWLDVTTSPVLQLVPRRFTYLSAGQGLAPEVASQSGLEGIVSLPDGSFAAVDEGFHVDASIGQPRILRVQRDGRVTGVSPAPAHYQIPGVRGTTGVRPNLGLESLTRTPSGHLVSGLEQPLMQDDVPSGFGRGGLGRLIAFAPDGDGWRAAREYAYHLAPTPRLGGYDAICKDGANGLTDLLALSDTTFLALERGCLINPSTKVVQNTALIFEVSIAEADDVAGRVSLRRGPAPRPVHKRLVLDLRDLATRLSPALARLENFEGLSFGPVPPGGGAGRSVLVLSDDNFSASQKTALLWFALGGAPLGAVP